MINKDNLYYGDIRKCIEIKDHPVCCLGDSEVGYFEYDEETVCYKTLLAKTKNGEFVYLKNLYLMEMMALKIIPTSNWLKMKGVLMNTSPSQVGEYFVAEETLRPYSVVNDLKEVAKVKK